MVDWFKRVPAPPIVLIVGIAVTACLIAVSQSRATFGGSNGLLVYQAQIGKHIQLFTIRPDGTGARQITRLKDSDALNPSWSPGGKRIAFARDYAVGTRREHLDISTVNADGSGLRGMGLRGLNGDPSWSPDGRIIWVRSPGFAMSKTGGTGFRVIRVAGDNSSPTFSPDGKHLAFRRQRGERKSAIFVANADGSHVRRVTAPAGGVADKIDWSPDGSRILFSAPEFGQPGKSSNAFTIRPDGSGLRQLTHSRGGKVNNGADSWSPDGKQIALVIKRGGAFRLYVMSAHGSHVTPITDRAANGHLAAWGTHP